VKIALYIEDGLEQIVLTPETDTEKGILGKLRDKDRQMSIYRGAFYDCNGGWKRWEKTYPQMPYVPGRGDEDSSTIIVLKPKPTEE
jgi:hypothetical protein